MKCVVPLVVLACSIALAAPPRTKNIYGQEISREEFEEMKQNLRPNPNWKNGEEGLRERVARLKKEFEGEGPQFSKDPAFNPKLVKPTVDRVKKQASVFHAEGDEVYVLLDPEPLVFQPKLRITLVSARLDEGGKPVRTQNVQEVEYSSWFSNGVSRGRYAFKLPKEVNSFDIRSGSAVFDISLPGSFEVIELTKEKPKAGGFELVELGENLVRVKFDRADAWGFTSEVHTAEGKPLQGFGLGDSSLARWGELSTKTWEELPETLPLPTTGSFEIGVVGPAHKVILYKAKEEKVHRVSSTWKRSF